MVQAGWLFALIRRLRPALTDGLDDTPWLDTTYLSPRMRLGRGNKGSVFVLTRLDSEGPLPPGGGGCVVSSTAHNIADATHVQPLYWRAR